MSDNPPAFPTDGRIQHGTAYDGMSLRDYFAGQAIGALIALHPKDIQNGCVMDGDVLALASYGIADELLAARKAPAA